MSNLEQGLLVCTIVITMLTLGFSLSTLLNRKDVRQDKPDDE